MKKIPLFREDVRSDEESHVLLWLQEATRNELVTSWEYEPVQFVIFDPGVAIETVQMKTITKQVERTLHPAKHYTPDFRITLSNRGIRAFSKALRRSIITAVDNVIWFDVKGSYNRFQGGDATFSLKQAQMWVRHGIYVEKVCPFKKTAKSRAGLFVDTYAPEKLRWKLNGKEMNVMGRNCKGVEDFIREEFGGLPLS